MSKALDNKNKLRDIISVREYGALVDGTTDDSTAVNAALTYVKANGGIAWIPAGTVRCRNLRMESGTAAWELRGSGKRTTTIKHSDGDGTLLIGNAGSSVPYTLSDFTVDCQFTETAHASANNAISFADTTGVVIRRVRVQNYKNNGILGFATVANTFGDCIGEDCEAIGNGATTNNGMLFSEMPRCKWIRCRAEDIEGSPGFGVQLKNDSRYGEMIDCEADTCNGAVVFGNDTATGVSYSKISGARAINCGSAFIAQNSYGNSIHFHYINMNSIVNHAIRVQTASVGNDIRADVVEGLGAARAAALFQTGCTDNYVEIGVIRSHDASSYCAAFESGADRNEVVVHQKPTLHSSGLKSEASFGGSELANRFTLGTHPGFPVQHVISGGVVTIPNAAQEFVILETEASAASDDLDTITTYEVEGRVLCFRTTNDARDVVVKHGTGNILLVGAADYTLGTRRSNLELRHNGTDDKFVEAYRATHT